MRNQNSEHSAQSAKASILCTWEAVIEFLHHSRPLGDAQAEIHIIKKEENWTIEIDQSAKSKTPPLKRSRGINLYDLNW